jgi:uncharacterized protein YcbK (DUF882 family)
MDVNVFPERRTGGLSRRRLLGMMGAGLAASAVGARGHAAADVRELGFLNLHTGERLRAAYWENGAYLGDALSAINHVLRDHRTNALHAIDTRLLDTLHALGSQLGNTRAFEVISGYRSPASNEMLRSGGHGVVKQSMHLFGKAIDVRLPGTGLSRLHAAACNLRAGGVGLYRDLDFIHVDTGRVRYW